MRDAGRDVDPVVGIELARLDDGDAGACERRAHIDEGDERPSLPDDPQVVLTTMEVEAPDDARDRGGQVGLDERGVREGPGAPQLAEGAAGVAVPGDRPVPDARQCRRRRGRVGGAHARTRRARRSVGA